MGLINMVLFFVRSFISSTFTWARLRCNDNSWWVTNRRQLSLPVWKLTQCVMTISRITRTLRQSASPQAISVSEGTPLRNLPFSLSSEFMMSLLIFQSTLCDRLTAPIDPCLVDHRIPRLGISVSTIYGFTSQNRCHWTNINFDHPMALRGNIVTGRDWIGND